ncbi:MAG: c-type cytochrome [Proteobacteria bacterium]|nr:c-type cytochrome [Pseudomonadota bacterium]
MPSAITAAAAQIRQARRLIRASAVLFGLAGLAGLSLGAVAFAARAVTPAPSAERGAALFAAHCASCHASRLGAAPNIGPNLFRVVGRRSGSEPDYRYSASLKTGSLIWTATTLDLYLADPKEKAPAGRMPHPGLKLDSERADVIAYLETLR